MENSTEGTAFDLTSNRYTVTLGDGSTFEAVSWAKYPQRPPDPDTHIMVYIRSRDERIVPERIRKLLTGSEMPFCCEAQIPIEQISRIECDE